MKVCGRRALRALPWVGAAVAAVGAMTHLGLLASIIARRIGYPLDLEWMEGGMLCHALRVMQGQPIYAAPSVDFISYLYTPFYPYVLAGLGSVFGLTYLLGRLVSVISLAGACLLLVLAARRHGGPRGWGLLWGIIGVGLVASAFPHTEAWYDLVRNDSLFLLLTVASIYLLIYHHRSWAVVAAAGVLMGLAFLTKQTAAVFVVASGLMLLLLSWRRLLLYVPTVGAVAGGAVLWLNWQSGGWFWRYIYQMHQGHSFYPDRLWPLTELALLKLFPAVAALMGLWFLVASVHWAATRRRPTQQGKAVACWFFCALVGVFVAALGFATQWAEENAYIPALYFAALFAAVGVGDLARRVGWGARPVGVGLMALLAGGALAVQLFGSLYAPTEHLPSATDRAAAASFSSLLGQLRGEVLIPYHPFYAHLVNKQTGYHQMGINDVTRAGYPMPSEIYRRFEQRYYDWIVLDTPPGPRYGPALRNYKLWRYLERKESPGVVTGFRVRPKYILQHKRSEPAPAGGRRVFDFEDGTYRGWRIEGRAFGKRPVGGPRANQELAGPYEGHYLASSRVHGDARTGRLISPEFVVRGPRLSYRIGGGRSPRVQLRLLAAGKEVHRATGSGKHVLQQRHVDVSQHQGQPMRVELVDSGKRFRDYILFDELIAWDLSGGSGGR